MPKNTSPGTALITGGSKRIGQAIALALAEMGYNIALHYNQSRGDAEKTADLAKKKGGKCTTFACDLSREKAVFALFKSVHQTFPDLNVLINSASIFEKSGLNTASLEAFNRHFAINLKAPLILISEFARVCKKGNIINLLDTHIVKNKTAHFHTSARQSLGSGMIGEIIKHPCYFCGKLTLISSTFKSLCLIHKS